MTCIECAVIQRINKKEVNQKLEEEKAETDPLYDEDLQQAVLEKKPNHKQLTYVSASSAFLLNKMS